MKKILTELNNPYNSGKIVIIISFLFLIINILELKTTSLNLFFLKVESINASHLIYIVAILLSYYMYQHFQYNLLSSAEKSITGNDIRWGFKTLECKIDRIDYEFNPYLKASGVKLKQDKEINDYYFERDNSIIIDDKTNGVKKINYDPYNTFLYIDNNCFHLNVKLSKNGTVIDNLNLDEIEYFKIKLYTKDKIKKDIIFFLIFEKANIFFWLPYFCWGLSILFTSTSLIKEFSIWPF